MIFWFHGTLFDSAFDWQTNDFVIAQGLITEESSSTGLVELMCLEVGFCGNDDAKFGADLNTAAIIQGSIGGPCSASLTEVQGAA